MSPTDTVIASIDLGVDRKRLKQVRKRFQQINRARLARTKSALAGRQQIFLDLLPLLFHVNHPMLPGYVSHQTPCGVSDYLPGKLDLARAQRLARSFVYRREPNPRCAIQGLFLMGSCGTVAQSSLSDFDIWVCHPASLDSEAETLLRRKCEGISRWARELGLEAHFFLMADERFRLGQREALSTEDCGSSQHYLLLDEFYRTGLLLAGRAPIWWLVPPEDEPHYNYCADTLRGKRFVRPDATVDFGGVAHIPAGEFVGAGVWQLYKAIDSPYKSVIKLLLTEVYAAEYPHVEPLSKVFKRAVYAEVQDIDELDPYVMVYRKLERYLLTRGELKRLELVRRCFYFKVGKALSRRPQGPSKSWQRLLMEKLIREWGWDQAHLANLDARPRWKIDRVMAEQKELVRELTNSYRFLVEFARRSQATSAINAQEMTVLGRKLYAAFERRAGKVEWVNPGIAPNLAEPELSFYPLPGAREDQAVWAVVPERLAPRELPRSAPLKRADNLIALLAWGHLNGLLSHDTEVRLGGPEHGVSELELQHIIRALRRTLPPPRGEQGLPQEGFSRPSHPTQILLLINVGSDPLAHVHARGVERLSDQTDSLGYSGFRDNLVLSVEQVTVNSWGEVSTRHYGGPHALINCLKDYLQLLPPGTDAGLPRLDVQCFCPTRPQAIAARVAELFRDVIACYYSGTRPPSARYVLEIQREFYVLQFIDGKPTVHKAPGQAALTEQLGRLQNTYSPIVLDRYCLPASALAAISQAGLAGVVQLFYLRREDRADVVVLDERDSLLYFDTPLHDERSLLGPLHQFIQSTLYRQRTEWATQLTDDDADLASETAGDVEYYELVPGAGGYQVQRRSPLTDTLPLQYFSVQAIADLDTDGNIVFSIYCDQHEFTELELGDTLYPRVARFILSRRQTGERYPCYITDLDLSRCVDAGQRPQTVHYLRYKQRLERAINGAIRNA